MGVAINRPPDRNPRFRAPGVRPGFLFETFSPEEVLSYFRSQGIQITDDYRDLISDERYRAFTVAKLTQLELLTEVHGEIDKAISRGISLTQFQDELIPSLQRAGWLGGDEKKLSTRLENIYRTNLAGSYAAGEDEQRRTAALDRAARGIRTFQEYHAVGDSRTRETHLERDGIVLPIDHPFWDANTPPLDYQCRCWITSHVEDQLERRGLKVTPESELEEYKPVEWRNKITGEIIKVSPGVQPGFGYRDWRQSLKDALAQRLAAAPSGIRKAVEATLPPEPKKPKLKPWQNPKLIRDEAGRPFAISRELANLAAQDAHTKAWLDEQARGYDLLPIEVKKLLERHELQIRVGRLAHTESSDADIRHLLIKRTPGSADERSDYREMTAWFDGTEREIVIGREGLDASLKETRKDMGRPVGTVAHEVGHAVDNALGAEEHIAYLRREGKLGTDAEILADDPLRGRRWSTDWSVTQEGWDFLKAWKRDRTAIAQEISALYRDGQIEQAKVLETRHRYYFDVIQVTPEAKRRKVSDDKVMVELDDASLVRRAIKEMFAESFANYVGRKTGYDVLREVAPESTKAMRKILKKYLGLVKRPAKFVLAGAREEPKRSRPDERG